MIDPDLNKDYAAWADHNHTVILPAKVRKPKWKSSVENAVGILEKDSSMIWKITATSLWNSSTGIFGQNWSIEHENFKKKDYSRYDRWIEERPELLPLPSVH